MGEGIHGPFLSGTGRVSAQETGEMEGGGGRRRGATVQTPGNPINLSSIS
jgi:hypothetical protein